MLFSVSGMEENITFSDKRTKGNEIEGGSNTIIEVMSTSWGGG